MEPQYTDEHIQVESGNDIFDRGRPRQVVRRDFGDDRQTFGNQVIWFEKSVYAGEGLQRLLGETADQLEAKYNETFTN